MKTSRLIKISLSLNNKNDANAQNESLTEYLEIVENFLIAHVAENFDFFTQSFDNIRDMEREMGEIKDSIQIIRDSNNLRK